jgi:hypothetical protein
MRAVEQADFAGFQWLYLFEFQRMPLFHIFEQRLPSFLRPFSSALASAVREALKK